MYFLALAADYDGTLADDGSVGASIYDALKRLKDRLDLFDRGVAENGAVVFDPGTRHQRVIAEKPPLALVIALKDQKVEPLSVGESIVATWSPHEQTVLKTHRDLGLEHQIISTKGQSWCCPRHQQGYRPESRARRSRAVAT